MIPDPSPGRKVKTYPKKTYRRTMAALLQERSPFPTPKKAGKFNKEGN